MKNIYIPLISLCIIFSANATEKLHFFYTKAQELHLIGKATSEGHFFHRIDTAKYHELPIEIKTLFTNSAGLAISFVTNSTAIKAKWTVPNRQQKANMTPIMQRGLDLYIKQDGVWKHAGVGKPNEIHSTAMLVENMDTTLKECLLYLPLYEEITNVEIGVTKGAFLHKGKNPFKGKIIVYGSSITQGASASRPGLAYPALLSRSSGWQFINMGLSGNGKMEISVAHMLADIEDVDAFILDCIPNPSPEEITERSIDFIKTIRNKHANTPIVVIQSIVRETGNFNFKVREEVERQNTAITAQIKTLHKEAINNLYFIKEEDFLGTDHEATIDGVHPNDLGFNRMLKQIKPALKRSLRIKFD